MSLATQADIGNLLRTTITDDDDLEAMLERASGLIVDWLGWNPEVEADVVETLEGDKSAMLTLKSLHVTALTSVVEDGSTLTEGNEGDYVWYSDGRLVRLGRIWPSKRQSIIVTYDQGYSVLPAGIVDACAAMAASAYTFGIAHAAVGGGFKSETMPDGYKYEKTTEAASALEAMQIGDAQRVALSAWRIVL